MPGKPLNVVLPTPSVSPGPAYASTLNTAIQKLVDDVEPLVTPDEIDVNQTLDVNAQLLEDVGALRLAALAAIASGAAHVRKAQADAGGDFWWNDGNGTPIQLTKNGALNAAAVKGFTGDYGAGGVNADASYSNATKTFTFTQEVNHAAKLNIGDIELREVAAGIVNKVTLKSPAALVASYAMTMPAAVPGSTSLITMSAAGVLATTRSPALDDPTATSLVAGALTTGQADTKHANRVYMVPLIGAHHLGAVAPVVDLADLSILFTNTTGSIVVGLGPMVVGSRLKSVSVRALNSIAAGVATLKVELFYTSTGTGRFSLGSATNSLDGDQSVGPAPNHTIEVDRTYYAEISWTRDGAQSSKVFSMAMTCDRVA